MKNLKTLADIIPNCAKKYGAKNYLGVKVAGQYRWQTFADFDIQMRKLRAIIQRLGVEKGDRVAIIANNSPQFALVAYASYGLGAIFVPMYEVQKTQDWIYILNDSACKLLFVANESIRDQILAERPETLKEIICFQSSRPEEDFNTLLEAEQDLIENQDVSPEDIADILYTSGTTGMPKGVVLSHQNVIEDCIRVKSLFDIDHNDTTLAFLPWAHAFGKTVELHVFAAIGASVALVESNRTIAQNMLEVNPTVLISVPKIFNKIYDVIHSKLGNGGLKKALFERFLTLADKERSAKLSALERVQYNLLDRVVAKKVRAPFGNRLRFCISGGVSLSSEVAFFFKNFKIIIYEGYGMTEASPIIAVNYENNNKIGSVGKPLPGISVRIEPDPDNPNSKQGEIIVSGPIVMQGYYKAEAATAEAINEKGELHTGDMGYIDEDGFVWITGRVKEQYKLENGKYIVPSALELKLSDSPIIDTAVVFGANRPYNVVLIIPNVEFIERFKAENQLSQASLESIASHPKMRDLISKELQECGRDFRGYEKPQKFEVVLEEFSIQNGLLSPALKVKRREVEKRFADLIQSMYEA